MTIDLGTDLSEVAVRLAAFARRTFADFGLGGPDVALAGVGLSPEDFSWRVLEDYVEGRLTHEASRGDVFALLATALRNDIIDSLRKAAHMREENRSSLRRERDSADGAPSLDELPANASDVSIILEEEEYCRRVWASLAGDLDLEEMVRAILDLNLQKPRDIAAALGITTTEVQNRKKRLPPFRRAPFGQRGPPVTNKNKIDSFDARAARIALLSESILGPPKEIDAAEAEDLLRAMNIDPQELKAEFHRRFDALAKQHAARGERVAPLLKQALADFRPGASHSRPERELLRQAQTATRQVLRQVQQLPQLLQQSPGLTLATAYRKKKELSEHDRELLDEIAEQLRNRGKDGTPGPSGKRKR